MKLEVLKNKLVVIGFEERLLVLYKGALHINSADHMVVVEENNKFKFVSAGGSRFAHTDTFDADTQVKECAEYIKKYADMSNDGINKCYRQIAGVL